MRRSSRLGGRATEQHRAEIEALVAVLTAGQIAGYFGIGRTTFFAMIRRDEEMERARGLESPAMLDAEVAS